DLPAAPDRRLAGRRPRRPPRLRPRLEARPGTDREAAPAARRALPALSLDRGPLLLGSRTAPPTARHRPRASLTLQVGAWRCVSLTGAVRARGMCPRASGVRERLGGRPE